MRIAFGFGFGGKVLGLLPRNVTDFTDLNAVLVPDIGASTSAYLEATFTIDQSETGIKIIVGRHSSDRFYIGWDGTAKTLLFANGGSFNLISSVISDNNIHTARLEVVGANVEAYLDGVLQGTQALGWSENLSTVAIGLNRTNNQNPFSGPIWNVKIGSGGVLINYFKLNETWEGASTVAVNSGTGAAGSTLNILEEDSHTYDISQGNLTGRESVSNGSDITTTDDWLTTNAASTLSAVGGNIRATSTGTGSFGPSITVPVVRGGVYTCSVNAHRGTYDGEMHARVSLGAGLGSFVESVTFSDPEDGTAELTFVATTTGTMFVGLLASTAHTLGDYIELSDVTVKRFLEAAPTP